MSNHLKRTITQEKLAQNSIEQIQRIKKLAERDSIPLVVVLIPDENQINRNLQQVLLTNKERSKFDFEMPQSMLKDMFADAAIPVIDLLPYFMEYPRCMYMNDTHWTAEGHALAAEVIRENIIDENMLPEFRK
jgi:CYTH domain-containing protein